MSLANLINSYGAGDNSTTDRVHYEDACAICLQLSELQVPLFSDDAKAAIRSQLEAKAHPNSSDLTSTADNISARLVQLGTPVTSRISVEMVRRELEKFHGPLA